LPVLLAIGLQLTLAEAHLAPLVVGRVWCSLGTCVYLNGPVCMLICLLLCTCVLGVHVCVRASASVCREAR
jgi:hypothetical protein